MHKTNKGPGPLVILWITLKRLVLGVALCPVFGCAPDPVIDASECFNVLRLEEEGKGWRLLFDGKSLANWRTYQEQQVNDGWAIENGCLARVGWGGDIIRISAVLAFILVPESDINALQLQRGKICSTC